MILLARFVFTFLSVYPFTLFLFFFFVMMILLARYVKLVHFLPHSKLVASSLDGANGIWARRLHLTKF